MESKRHSDLFLPNQEFARYLYRDAGAYQDALYALVTGYAGEFRREGFAIKEHIRIGTEEMSSPPFLLAFINGIVKLIDAKTVLEIGTFIGISAMQFARMVGPDGHVTTLEVGKEFADIARQNFLQNGFSDRIMLIEGDAGATLKHLPKHSFDLVFIDGAKETYLEYAKQAEELITDKGVIVVDDVFFHGDALNATPQEAKGAGCKRLLDHYRDNQDFEKMLLPLRNGLLLLFRRRAATRK
jgi:caffeoyl-CoA O-methyltransferase